MEMLYYAQTPTKILGGFFFMTVTTNFKYKPTRDIIGMLTSIAVLIFLLAGINVFFMALVAEDPSFATMARWSTIIYLVFSVWFALYDLVDIFSKTHNCLTISCDAVVYKKGWLSQTEITIPAHKIRSCSKSISWMQKLCGSMDISITTAGDSDEIYFRNIADGDEAYRMISELAKLSKDTREP